VQADSQAFGALSNAREAYIQAKQAIEPSKQAYNMADAHFRTQGSWGIGAALLADVLLLVGVVAWQKITFKP